MKTADLAAQLGVSPQAVLNHKARKPDQIQEGTHYTNEGGMLDWTDEGVALLMTLTKNNPINQDTSTRVLPDPQRVGENLAQLAYRHSTEGYRDTVDEYAVREYERLMSVYHDDLGKDLASHWGLDPDVVTELLRP